MSRVSDYVFPGARDGIRASFSTWANGTGAARPDVVEAALAHKENDAVRRAYNRAEFIAERRALLEAWGGFIEGHPVKPAKVVAATGDTMDGPHPARANAGKRTKSAG